MMPDETTEKHLELWTPAVYLIEVEGHLDNSWSDRLGGMQIKTHQRKDQSKVTKLTGLLKDQAELAGILNSLYEFHMPILQLKKLDCTNGEEKPGPDMTS